MFLYNISKGNALLCSRFAQTQDRLCSFKILCNRQLQYILLNIQSKNIFLINIIKKTLLNKPAAKAAQQKTFDMKH